MQTYRKIEKNEANIYKFLSAFKKGRRHIFLAFGVPLLWVFIDKLLGLHPPNFITILVGFFASIKLLQWIYIFWLGNARCPQCGATPIANERLFGVGPSVGFGVPLFECQIKRCCKCDYPLSLKELEKDLAK